MESVVLFKERQAMWQNPIMWGVLPGMIFAFTMVFTKAKPDGSIDWTGVWVLAIVFGLLIFLVVLGNMRTEITEECIRVRWFPLQRKVREIRWADVKKAELRNYSPLTEYGGWGLKGSRKNRAYNVTGDRGLQLELNDGKKVLIGTRKSEALEALLHELRRKSLIV
jgi:hypothetical protein